MTVKHHHHISGIPRNYHSDKLSFLIAFILYIPSVFFVSNYALYFTILIALVIYRKLIKFVYNDIIIVFIIIYALLNINFNAMLHETPLYNIFKSYGIIFIYFTILLARNININVIRYLIILIIIECLFGIFEFFIGKPILIESQTRVKLVDNSLMYFSRVFGLSSNSSAFAQKVMIGIILLFSFRQSIKKWHFAFAILNFSLFISFNRSVILAISFFYLIILIKYYTSRKFSLSHLTLLTFLIAAFSIVYIQNEYILREFSAGRSIDSFSRTVRINIWKSSIHDILRNPLIGNHSLGYKVELYDSTKQAHAHNSYLQILATHGIFISLLLTVFIASSINRLNILYLLPIFIYCLFQHGIFWNVSLLDLVFYSILFRIKPTKHRFSQSYKHHKNIGLSVAKSIEN